MVEMLASKSNGSRYFRYWLELRKKDHVLSREIQGTFSHS
uniref:Uncharacterized protein n=1 Tax=Arundo donax TaxID=35708 RepID=A0A0A8Y7T9_ARUDO